MVSERRPLFRNRAEGGKALAIHIAERNPDPGSLVLALPRGGVPVAWEVACALGAELDVLLVRKLGAPHEPELAIGAIASGGARVLNRVVIEALQIPPAEVDRVAEREERELRRAEARYRSQGENTEAIDFAGRTVIVVDDGIATGASMWAVFRTLRAQDPRRVILSAPIASRIACAELDEGGAEVICAATPEPFVSVGTWYGDFTQVTDREVRDLLARDC